MNGAVPRWHGWPHILETKQFHRRDLEPLLEYMREVEEAYCKGGALLGTLPRRSKMQRRRKLKIYRDEASTRTEDTFAVAGMDLGYDIRLIQGEFSSAMKGESLEDLVMAVTRVGGLGHARTADFFIIRHKTEATAARAAKVVDAANEDGCLRVPLSVINAGDGSIEHPTQALVDLFTIYQERKSLSDPLGDLTIVMTGDTLYSRTVNSLCHLLGRYGGSIQILFSCHEELRPKKGIVDYLKERGIKHEYIPDLKGAIKEADVVYVTRIQKERFPSQELYHAVKGAYVIHAEHLDLLKPGAIVMHPLPIDKEEPPAEIDPALEAMAYRNHPQCAWGRQSMRGLFVRYALLDLIDAGLEEEEVKIFG